MDDVQKEQVMLYARLKSEEKRLKERIAELQQIVFPIVYSIDGVDSKLETSLGNFSIKVNKTWTYPENVVELEAEYKKAKKDAERTGAATFEQSESLYFRENKDNEE